MSWRLSATLQPSFNGALMDAVYLRGGFRIVNTQAQMLSIPFLYRTANTIVFITSTNAVYRLINNTSSDTTILSDWEVVQLGAGSALEPIGTWDPNTNTPLILDITANGKNGQFYFVENTPISTNFTIPGLFQGQQVSLINGVSIVSVGTEWIIVNQATSWETLNKPQVIDDYVNGIVQYHTHSVNDIIGLGNITGDFYTIADTADHTLPFNSVSDLAIIELEFLKEWYYRYDQIEALVVKRTGDSGIFRFTFSNNQGIDTDGLDAIDVLNIGTINADIINIGGVSTVVNFAGTVNYNNQVNLAVEDKLIRLNVNGAVASGFSSGFEIEEDGLITGYFTTNSSRDGYLMNAPASASDAEFLLSSLTASRAYTLPDASGTLALTSTTLSTALTSANFWLGNVSDIATQRVLSGDATMDNLGALTIANDAITTSKILDSAVTLAKLEDISTLHLLGRHAGGAGPVQQVGLGGGLEFNGANIQSSAYTGDVTKTAGGTALTIAADAVTYAKIQDVTATSRFLGRITGGAGIVEELTGTEATTLLDNFTDALKGLAPASGGGTSNFLRADGSWAAPGGSGHAIFNGVDVGSLTQRANLRFNNGLTASDDTPDTLVQLGGDLLTNTVLSGSPWLAINTGNFGLFSASPNFEEGEKIMFMGVCTTPPVTPPTAGVYIFVQLINSNYELRIMDSGGNIKGLS